MTPSEIWINGRVPSDPLQPARLPPHSAGHHPPSDSLGHQSKSFQVTPYFPEKISIWPLLHIDVYKLFSSKDTLTRRTGWSLFLAAYSLFLVDLFLWRFPQPEMAPPLLHVEQVGSDTIKVIIWALSTNLNLSVTGGTAYLEAGSWSRQPEKGDWLIV